MGQEYTMNVAFMGEENIGIGIIETLFTKTRMCKEYKKTLTGWHYLDVDFIEQKYVKKEYIKILNSNDSSKLKSFSEKNSESDSHLCLIIDETNKKQFDSLKNAFQQVKKHFQNFDKTLIVKKTPDVDAEETQDKIAKLAKEFKASIFVLYQIDGESVENLFKQIRSRILRKKGEKPSKCCG